MADMSHLQTPSGRMMDSASNLVITGGSFIATQSNVMSVGDKKKNLRALYNVVSLNAILNSGGRADPVRCFPGTREEVMAHIERWIDNQDCSDPIFWLSGPAGAGKSAIAQSIAERCLERGISMINFFFFRSDVTRSHARPLVATLLYQIFDLFPDADSLKGRIEETISNKPLVFNASLDQQFGDLMYHAVDYLRGLCEECRRVVVIIDGLDECAQENQATQQELLRALHALSKSKNSSLKIFIGSRAEPHLIMAFNELPCRITKIFLDADNYRPSDDIRNMVVGQFERIKKSHHLSWTLSEDWPPTIDIEEVVTKSSGQFIYAATVMRYIASSPESPSHSLERVKGIHPVISNSPFAALDAIYTHILSCVNDWQSAKDLLAAHILTGLREKMLEQFNSLTPHRAFVFKALGYAVTDIPSCLSDLTALLQFNPDRQEIVFYHTSLVDFLLDRVRSGTYFIDLSQFRIKLVPILFNSHMEDAGFWHFTFSQLLHIEHSDADITKALLRPPMSGTPTDGLKFIGVKGVSMIIAKIKELYLKQDFDIYRRILTIWLIAFRDYGDLSDRLNFDEIDEDARKIWTEIAKSGGVENNGVSSQKIAATEWESSDAKKYEIDLGQAGHLLPSEVSGLIAEIEGFRSEMSLARMELRNAWDELLAAQADAQDALSEASKTRSYIQDAYAEIETVRQETDTARKALFYAWAEVGRAADAREVVSAAGRAEAHALRAEVHSLQTELRSLQAELAIRKDSRVSWSTNSKHPANGSTLFLYHDSTSGDSQDHWIVI